MLRNPNLGKNYKNGMDQTDFVWSMFYLNNLP